MFEIGKRYPSAVKGRAYVVSKRFRVQDTDCLLVYAHSLNALFGRTSLYYPAIIEHGNEGTATVLLDEGFTTIYDEEIE